MIRTVLIIVSGVVVASGSLGHAQIKSFEFGYGLTNSLAVPSGKILRIHSLIGSSGANWASQSASYSYASESLGRANRGITIELPSGARIDLSPYLVSVGGSEYYMATSVLSSINSVSPNSPLLLPGPITITKNGNETMLLVYEIMDNLGSSSAAQTPSQGSSVVVPTSAAGDVDVKMEQSADNVTWTECLPGTYNSSTVKRFFRLRAVEK
jgi:hypothetical protein